MSEKAQAVRLSIYSSPSLNEAVSVAASKQMMSMCAWVRGAVLERLAREEVKVGEVQRG